MNYKERTNLDDTKVLEPLVSVVFIVIGAKTTTETVRVVVDVVGDKTNKRKALRLLLVVVIGVKNTSFTLDNIVRSVLVVVFAIIVNRSPVFKLTVQSNL